MLHETHIHMNTHTHTHTHIHTHTPLMRCFPVGPVFAEWQSLSMSTGSKAGIVSLSHLLLTVGWARSIRSNLRNVNLSFCFASTKAKQKAEKSSLLIMKPIKF